MKKIGILGLGKSGLAAAEWLLSQRHAVIGFDDNKKQTQDIDRLVALGLKICNASEEIDWDSLDLMVVSPGVPSDHPLYKRALERKIEVIGEAELALRSLPQRAVAITGTNGKTTVTLLVEHILKAAGIKARALGNIGEPLSLYALQSDPEEVLVIELSSFQIETLSSPLFDAAVILNITPDHLDRYASMEDYARAKCALQKCLYLNNPKHREFDKEAAHNSCLEGATIVRAEGANEDKNCEEKLTESKTDSSSCLGIREKSHFFIQNQAAQTYGHLLFEPYMTFGVQEGSCWHIDGNRITCNQNLEWEFPKLFEKLGLHDKENALAAWLLCRIYGVSREQFINALETFQKPPHRIEFVCEIDGICYYDDSKGTNIDAVVHAVSAMKGDVVLIAGGVDKGASYLPWAHFLKGKVKSIITLGQAASKMQEELGRFFEIVHVGSIAEAVVAAADKAVKGDVVLLSPGCSSYDMFENYAHRGQEFKRCVYNLCPNNLKNREFGKEASQIFRPAQAAVLIDTARARDEKSGTKPTTPKTDSSNCLGISKST
jgi:UDP-N-acetylmuramoylalanine--D-glutamate ligase